MGDRANCPNMEGRFAKSREIPRHHTSKSHQEGAREDPGTAVVAREDPGTAVAGREDPGTAVAAREDPGTAVAAREDPGTAVAAREDPGTAVAAREDPGTAVAAREDPGTAVADSDIEEVGDAMENGSGICGLGEGLMTVMATVRWMGVPEAEAKMVEAMHERTKGRVVVGSGLSEEFPVNSGLRKGSALSPLPFIMVMELINRKINTKDVLRKIMYADDLAIIAESNQELQEVLEEWKGVFKKHGLRMSLEKTEVM